MTRQKKLKKAIRARALKTGESYTAARRQLLARRRGEGGHSPTPAATPRPAAIRTVAAPRGLQSEASLIKKTGHGFDHWFAVLDAFDAAKKGHTAAAAHLYDDHSVPSWHCQMITVAFERERGLRAANQSCAGDFQVSVSKTLAASVAEIADAISRPERRRRWLRGADPALSTALIAAFEGPKAKRVTIKSPTDARMRYRWDKSTVEIRINGKPKGGASIVAANTGLDRAEQVEPRRAQWKLALEALKDYLK